MVEIYDPLKDDPLKYDPIKARSIVRTARTMEWAPGGPQIVILANQLEGAMKLLEQGDGRVLSAESDARLARNEVVNTRKLYEEAKQAEVDAAEALRILRAIVEKPTDQAGIKAGHDLLTKRGINVVMGPMNVAKKPGRPKAAA